MRYDLGVENGTLVTPKGRRRANVYVREGRIAAVTAERLAAATTVDAYDLMVMPGMVDVHVHFMDPAATEREDFPTGSAAAARAGVTTVIEHTHAGPVRTASDLRDKADYLANRSHVDFSLGAHGWPDQLDQIGPVWQAGAAFIKIFTCTTHGIPGFDREHLQSAFAQVAADDAVALVHCEDEALAAAAERRLRDSGREDGGVIPEWRNRESELAAVTMTASTARRTRARVVVAHASSSEVIETALAERGKSGRVRIETCPQYLFLLEEEASRYGAFRKFTPPARARTDADLDAMWAAVADGRIDYVSSDHAPATRQQKSAGSIWDVHFGLPGIDTTLSALLDGASRGLITYERLVEVYSEAPARLYGMRGKGRLVRGADADIVLVDPTLPWTVSDADIISKAGWSPFSGRTFRGRAVATFLRGTKISESGRVVGEPGAGRFLKGGGARAV